MVPELSASGIIAKTSNGSGDVWLIHKGRDDPRLWREVNTNCVTISVDTLARDNPAILCYENCQNLLFHICIQNVSTQYVFEAIEPEDTPIFRPVKSISKSILDL